jgi:hypothetical protein
VLDLRIGMVLRMLNRLSRILAVVVVATAYTTTDAGQAKPESFAPLRFLEGTWRGTGTGQPGISTVEREYRFELNGRFLVARNKSTYAPQEKNPKGEVHEDVAYISFDSGRRRFVMRQFHVEGFVNQYVAESVEAPSRPARIVFVSESIENIPSGWRARETYAITGDDQFTEVFELAEPGKEFSVYSENRLRRIR